MGDSQTIIATEGSATCFAGLPILTRFCWLHPEHRNITLLRIEMLDPEQRQSLDPSSMEYEARLSAPN